MVVIDFETYWDKEFSLSKMTTEAYIRDPRFEVIGVSVKKNTDPIIWFSGNHEDTKTFLQGLHLENEVVVAHNAVFDCAILNWIYGIRPKYIVDTLSMARPITGLTVGGSLRALAEYFGIGEKGTEVYNTLGKHRADFTTEELEAFGRYCDTDVQLTYDLLPHLKNHTTKTELFLTDLTIRMFTEPVIELDREMLEEHLKDVVNKKEEMFRKIGCEDRTRIMSNDQFAEWLKEAGVEPPTKISPTTGKETWAFAKTDEAFKELLNHPNPEVQALVTARLSGKSTIEETRTQAFLDIAKRGPMPIMLNYYGAANTGRMCLTGDTVITVLHDGAVFDKRLDELEDDDLVWDGEAFVEHEGLIDQGEREVITYQGVTGTPDHRVFVEDKPYAEGPITLLEASIRNYTLASARTPKQA